MTDTSSLFFKSSFGVGKELAQTGVNGPSIFPTTSLAARVRIEPGKSFYFQSGVFNAQAGDPTDLRSTNIRYGSSDGLFLINEAAYLRGASEGSLPGKYALGFWNYTRTFDHLINTSTDSDGNSVPAQNTNQGYYLLADQHLTENFSAFLRYGTASAATNRFSTNVSGGFVWTGLVPTRTRDRFGIGITQVKNGNEQKALDQQNGTISGDSETTFEVNYRIELSPGVAIQPDYQLIKSPNTDPSRGDASVYALRLELNF